MRAWFRIPFLQKQPIPFIIWINTLDHEVQSSSDDTANKSQENTAKGNAANEKVVSTETVVDDQPEDKTCIAGQTGSFIEKTELPALLADSVGSNKEDNPRRSNAKKGGKKSRNKSKLVGIVESHEQSEKEKTSVEEKSKWLLLENMHNIKC